jgi:mono/diheme cytochrome c family protein
LGVLGLLIGIAFAATPAASSPVPAAAAAAAGEPDEAQLRALARDPAVVAAGRMLFGQYCQACHGTAGQGLQGPNLRDDFWLHGSDMGDLVRSIRDGYPARGMLAWSAYYSPEQIHDLAAFVASLHGSEDGTGKAPEGKLQPITWLGAGAGGAGPAASATAAGSASSAAGVTPPATSAAAR